MVSVTKMGAVARMTKTTWMMGLVVVGATAAACAGKSRAERGTPAAREPSSMAASCVPIGGGTDATVPTDSPVMSDDGGVESSVSMRRLAFDASDAAEAEPPSDPCPPVLSEWLDCDKKCNPPPSFLAACQTITCGPTLNVTLGWNQNVPTDPPYVVRTPEAPGVDPNCATQCPGQGFVYGMGFKVDPSSSGSFVMKVDPRGSWFTAPPLPFARGPTTLPGQCIWIANTDTRPVYVLTTDPNAPARNIHLELSNDPHVCM